MVLYLFTLPIAICCSKICLFPLFSLSLRADYIYVYREVELRKWFFVVWLLLLTCCRVVAQQLSDSLQVGLLTCSPGDEVYQLYGHTALRVRDLRGNQDFVFNYGVFDFNTPHFTWRFVLGKCDYEVMAYPFDLFLEEYRRRGSSVVEQTLALTDEEAQRLVRNLAVNALPENKTYRYNFLLNNCTTKARDMVEQAIDGHVVYAESEEHPTYRQLLHRYTQRHPWAEEGNDLLLGAACDTVLSDRAMQFLPELLMGYFAEAQIYDTLDNRRPLVAETTELLPLVERPLAAAQGDVWDKLTPGYVSCLAILVTLAIMLVEFKLRRMLWGVDIVLMVLQGLAGLLLCFMFLFSQHPTMDSNWQVWLLNPLPLVCLPWVVRCAIKQKKCLFHYVNLFVLGLFVVFMLWIPQQFSALTLTLALVLLARPISYLVHYSLYSKSR